jgi:hypothetical protein
LSEPNYQRFDTVAGVQPGLRPMARDTVPSAVNRTIQVRSYIRGLLSRDPVGTSITGRSSLAMLIGVALETIQIPIVTS